MAVKVGGLSGHEPLLASSPVGVTPAGVTPASGTFPPSAHARDRRRWGSQASAIFEDSLGVLFLTSWESENEEGWIDGAVPSKASVPQASSIPRAVQQVAQP